MFNMWLDIMNGKKYDWFPWDDFAQKKFPLRRVRKMRKGKNYCVKEVKREAIFNELKRHRTINSLLSRI